MSKCVLLLEDEPELASLVEELLTDAGFRVVHVPDVDGLVLAARQHSPCVALIDARYATGKVLVVDGGMALR